MTAEIQTQGSLLPLGQTLPTWDAPDISQGIVCPSLGSLGLEENPLGLVQQMLG